MKKKTLLLVIGLMSLSLVGLIGFQAYWIQHAVQMEEEVFDRNVNDALHQVVRRMETQEALIFLKEEAPQLRKAALSTEYALVPEEKTKKPKVKKTASSKATSRSLATLSAQEESDKNLTFVEVNDGKFQIQSKTPNQRSFTILSAGKKVNEEPSRQTDLVPAGESQRIPSRVIFRSRGADTTYRVAKEQRFGRTQLDSVVIWRLLAAQNKPQDSARMYGYGRQRQIAKAKIDTSLVQRIAFDTLTQKTQIAALQQIPTKNIQSIHINGKVMTIYTDSLMHLSPTKAYILPIDSNSKAPRPFTRSLKPNSRTLEASRSLNFKPSRQNLNTPPTQERITQENKIIKEQVTAQKAEAKAQHLNQVMEKMAAEYVRKEKPLHQRLQELDLEQMVDAELKNRNIHTPYHLQVKSDEASSFVLASNNQALIQPAGVYQTRLFPNDVLTTPSYLLLNFPDRNAVVWQSLLVPTFISALFTLIIILTFSFTLFTILRQKKISEIRNDFINNMTHEFKTPIATISLALDALVNPKVRKDEVRVDYYARIIKDENRRMHQQVEKVLQTAQMERNNLQLAFEPVDVHALIRKAAEPFQLHIEQRQGVLDLKLDAENPIIWADRSHLANMIGNLLDNANKYSPEAPKITIQTAGIAKGLHISVEDQGAGMSREAQKRVFEKFYRVPTGNVHNVKGFGLGLSYVKTMAQAHSGTIHLRSELGRGSKFTLWLPAQKAQPHH